GVADGALQQRAAQQLASHRQLAQELLACSKGSCPTHSNELINDGRHSQLQIRPSLQFSAKAAIQTANMMFSILRRKVARHCRFSRSGESEMDDRTSGPAAVGDATVDDEAGLRGRYQQPMGLAVLKQLDRLDAHCRNFLAYSPFAVIGSTRPGRGTDVSPRGDAPGFARVLDDHTIAIPDRPGNNRLDTLSNIVTDADVGLLFFIPGIDETLRINGTAKLSRDPELLSAAAV